VCLGKEIKFAATTRGYPFEALEAFLPT